jgi:hypothetical protein
MAVDMSKWPMGFAIAYSAAVKAGNTALVNAMKGGPTSTAWRTYSATKSFDPKVASAYVAFEAAKTALTKADNLAKAAYKEFNDAFFHTATITQLTKITYYSATEVVGNVRMSTTGTYSGISSGDQVFIYPLPVPWEGMHTLTNVVGDQAWFPITKQSKVVHVTKNSAYSPTDAWSVTKMVKGSGVQIINNKYKIWKPLSVKAEAARKAYIKAQELYTAAKKADKTVVDSKPVVQTPTTTMTSSTGPVKKNLPAVIKEMYFPDTPEFNGTNVELAGLKYTTTGKYNSNQGRYVLSTQKHFTPAKTGTTGILHVPSGNVSQAVKEASELWQNSKSSKGMIQQWMSPKIKTTSGSSTAGNASTNYNKVQPNKVRTAYQFIYNPSTIDMTWGGTPNVDIGLIMSGQDKIPFMGAGFTSSTITFQILVNRMSDMKYLGDIDATPIGFFQQLYNRSDVTTTDLKDIRDNGTMYDIEYLLNTLVPYKMKSVLRKRWTSDIGYLHAFPIEVHLGKGMRYLGIISSFNINHKIFNENMIPLMTWVNVTVSRIPDVAYDKNEITWNQGV